MKRLTSSIYSFEKLRGEDYLYVDKTEFLWRLIEPAGESYFLSRPRRFGKSLTVFTLKAIFEGKKELFKGLAIYDKPYDWKQYPVIHLDLGDYSFIEDPLRELPAYLMTKVKAAAKFHSVTLKEETPGLCLGELIDELAKREQVVILIDEYDKPILENVSNSKIGMIQKILKGFYGVLKNRNALERFLFITGVSKFSHVSIFSDLNNLTDITMDARYATMLGYTQEELDSHFGDRIKSIAQAQNLTEDAFKAKLKEWYDGYRFEETSPNVYNPVSIAKFFENGGKFNNYWFSTGTPSFLLELAKKTNFNFEKILSNPVPGVAFDAYEIDRIDPLALLLQTGYFTIKSSEIKFNKTWYQLDFPNEEVAESFNTYLLNSYVGKSKTDVTNFCADLASAFLANDLAAVKKLLEVFFAEIPYPIHKKSEATFQTIFYAIFRLLGYNIEAESCSHDGRIDAVVQTDTHIYLFEFKLNQDADAAIAQIKEKDYFRKYMLSGKHIILIGANFDSAAGQLSDWKTEEVKA